MQALVDELMAKVHWSLRKTEGPFLFSIDHCFGIKGQGTVLTGTVLSGKAAVNGTVELPELMVSCKPEKMGTSMSQYGSRSSLTDAYWLFGDIG